MFWNKDKRGDRKVTLEIHRLFWEANFKKKPLVLITYAMRIPAFAIFLVLIPLVVAFALEAIIEGRFAEISRYAYMIAGLGLLYCVLWGVSGVIISKAGAYSAAYLQRKVFQNFINKDYDFYSNAFFGSLGAQAIRLRDSLIEYNLMVTLSIPKQVVIVVASIAVIAYQSPILALATFLSMGAVLSFTIMSSSVRLKYRRIVSQVGSYVAGGVGDALTQSQTVKSFASEDYEANRLNQTLKPWERAQYKSWVASAPSDVGRAILAFIATIILLIMTAKLYQAGEISIAIVALVQLYVIRLIGSTLEIAEILKSYEHAMGGAYEPVKTMFVQSTINDKPKAKKLAAKQKLAISFDNVTFGYPEAAEGVNAVSNFSLNIKPGQKIGLIGFSGSGKTTLTKLLLRFMDVTGGSIKIDGTDLRDLTQKSLRQAIAYVPQEPLLFHRSILENIAYGRPDATESEVRQAAKMAYIDEFISELPEGYNTLVGERGVKLSGGQRQRVAIARAILKDAPILVLDEATSALNSHSEHYIQEALNNLLKNRTALVIAHRLSTIQRMDHIVAMDKGSVVQQGSHQNLLKDKKGVYAKLWAHQSGGYIMDKQD